MESGLTGYLLSALLLYQYPALFALEYVSALGVPLPSAAALVASGVFASQGYFSLPAVLALGFLGNILGDISLFFLARRFRRRILKLLRIKEAGNAGVVGTIEKYLYAHSGATIAFSRLSGSGSPAVSALSGISHIEAGEFIPFAVLGEIAYALLYVFIGYFLGIEWEDISGFAIPVGLIIIAAIAIFFAIRNRKKPSASK